jgi:hypothetical protein
MRWWRRVRWWLRGRCIHCGGEMPQASRDYANHEIVYACEDCGAECVVDTLPEFR